MSLAKSRLVGKSEKWRLVPTSAVTAFTESLANPFLNFSRDERLRTYPNHERQPVALIVSGRASRAMI